MRVLMYVQCQSAVIQHCCTAIWYLQLEIIITQHQISIYSSAVILSSSWTYGKVQLPFFDRFALVFVSLYNLLSFIDHRNVIDGQLSIPYTLEFYTSRPNGVWVHGSKHPLPSAAAWMKSLQSFGWHAAHIIYLISQSSVGFLSKLHQYNQEVKGWKCSNADDAIGQRPTVAWLSPEMTKSNTLAANWSISYTVDNLIERNRYFS